MLPGFSFPKKRPESAEETVAITNETFRAAGLLNSYAALLQPASDAGGFTGAIVELVISEKDLKDLFGKIIETKAQEQGGKVSDVSLRLSSTGPNGVGVSLSATVKMMMASVNLRIDGEIFKTNTDALGIRKLTLDAGTGMFAGMAAAMMRPRLTELEGKSLSLTQLTGMSLQIEQLLFEESSLKIQVSA